MGYSVLIWTRSEADWEGDEQLLARAIPRGATIVRVPCIQTVDCIPEFRPGRFDGFVFTSSKAAACAVANPELRNALEFSSSILTHGQKTAAFLRRAGLEQVRHIDVRTAGELCAWILQNIPRPARLAVPGPETPAFPMAAELAGAGFDAEAIACYRTEPGILTIDGAAVDARRVATSIADWHGVVLFASPSAVTAFVRLFNPSQNRLRDGLIAASIGPTTGETARAHFKVARVADQNSLESLIELGCRSLAGA